MSAYLVVCVTAFLAATILPFSSELVLLGYLQAGESSIAMLVFVATLGNVAGACVNWYLGRFLFHFKNKKWFPVKDKEIKRASAFFLRYGQGAVLLAWVPVIGDPLTVVAGFLKMNFWPFLILVSLGKGARYLFISWWFW